MNYQELMRRSFWRQVEEQQIPEEQWPLQALLCRGFLAEQTPDGALVVGVNAALMRRYSDLALASVRGGGVITPEGVLFRAQEDRARAGRQAERIMLAGLPSLNGMTGRNDWGPGLRFSEWNHFRKVRWGPRIPVRVLEPGVALLVKTLPLIRVWTWLSCDGHGDGKEPFICALDMHYFRWLRGVMRHITPAGLQQDWQFHEHSKSNYACRWTLGPPEEGQEAWARAHARNVQAARILLHDPLLHKIHAAHARIKSPADLTDEKIARFLEAEGVPTG